MNKEEFFNQIKEAEKYYYKNNPCYKCGPGNGCDDCRGCKDGEISHKMWKELDDLKTEYKNTFGADYNKEVEEIDKAYREKVRKEKLLKEVWETCSFDEIIDAGFDNNKCSGVQLLEAASEFDIKTDSKANFIERLRILCEETPKRDLPWSRDVMEVLVDYFYEDGMIDYFDKDDLIDRLDGTYEMDKYLREHTDNIINEWKEDNQNLFYTFNDFVNQTENMTPNQFKRFLCDITSNGYYCSDETLINDLKKRIE